MAERLQKLLSQWGIASRRQAEALIESGRVQVNGAIAHVGQKADPLVDRVALDGQIITPENRPDAYYLLLNKPLDVVCTCDDPWGRSTVLDPTASAFENRTGHSSCGAFRCQLHGRPDSDQ
jgi:16S rRNA U516 pseudouridylate synthase RsuA-like enzyme